MTLRNDCANCEHVFIMDKVIGHRYDDMQACEYNCTAFPSAIACTTYEPKKPADADELFFD